MSKVLLKEYRDLTESDPRPQRTVLETALTSLGGDKLELVKVSAGWACAGSVARYDPAHYGVFFYTNGTKHGQRYAPLDYDKAKAHFERIKA